MLPSDIGQNQKFNLRVSNLVSHVEDMTNKSAFSGYILPWVDMFLTFSTFSKILYNLEEGGWKHQNWAHDDYYAYYESQHLCDNRQVSLTFSGAQQCKQKSKIDTFILMWCLILTKCSKQRLANKSFFIANIGRLIAVQCEAKVAYALGQFHKIFKIISVMKCSKIIALNSKMDKGKYFNKSLWKLWLHCVVSLILSIQILREYFA